MTAADQDQGAPGWQCSVDERINARIYQRGQHCQGNFIRVYVPREAENPDCELRVILYLHGFALCLPSFYEDHLRELTRQGWIVVFPDFQRSSYREESLTGGERRGSATGLVRGWGKSTGRLITRDGEAAVRPEDLPEEIASALRSVSEAAPEGALPELKVGDLRRVLLPWLLISLILGVIGWFRRTYARNLGQLIGTVLLSLAYSPKQWLASAIAQTQLAWSDLARLPLYAHWSGRTPLTYGFGHSLGGLLCLSLPYGLESAATNGPLQPRVLLTADPATNTEMGIPGFAIWLLKLFGAPFTADPLDIRESGSKLTLPVAILHGLEDTIVPPQLWAASDGSGAFAAIASQQKALYFASSNRQSNPTLIAFHNQAVTSTQYYDDALFENFGGVKNGPNAYNSQWIWPALSALFNARATPADLLDHLPERPFAVSATPPPPRRRWF